MNSSRQISAWGRLSRARYPTCSPTFSGEGLSVMAAARLPVLPFGQGRSYGDVALNATGLIETASMDRLIACDWDQGVVRAEAGLSLGALLQVCVPKGWFLPVTPGTRYVSLGGAIANDVHGKNHHLAGSFGSHVTALGLARSSGEALTLHPGENTGLFAATVGGLGLTGLILWAEIKLIPIASSQVEVETLAMANLDDFFRLDEESQDWPYTVAWVDCLAKGRGTGRGLYMRGRHSAHGPLTPHGPPKLVVPFSAPRGILNPLTLSAFNLAYRKRPWAIGRQRTGYAPFFYPLDSVAHWNRLYGAAGFYQFQGVAPSVAAFETAGKLLETVAESGQGSFLTVLKRFGTQASPGLLSFPMPGSTLALDFPNRGEETLRLMRRLNEIVLEAGGRVYPAKDAALTPDQFAAAYPNWRQLEQQRDPAMISDFWRRVTGARA